MNRNQLVIHAVLNSLPGWKDHRSVAATAQQLAVFVKAAKDRTVPDRIIEQRGALYSTCNGLSYDTVVAFQCCSDPVIFEWWAKSGELWLGQTDFHTLRWSNRTDMFCLGDASDPSFGEEYESRTLIGLIDLCIREIGSA